MQAPELAPALRRIINHGINAGKPRAITEVILDQLTALNATAATLKRNGYTIISAQAGNGLPTICIEADRLTDEMLYLNRACIYREAIDHRGKSARWGQFAEKPNGVRVIFKERN
jgi:hypothetical protein